MPAHQLFIKIINSDECLTWTQFFNLYQHHENLITNWPAGTPNNILKFFYANWRRVIYANWQQSQWYRKPRSQMRLGFPKSNPSKKAINFAQNFMEEISKLFLKYCQNFMDIKVVLIDAWKFQWPINIMCLRINNWSEK